MKKILIITFVCFVFLSQAQITMPLKEEMRKIGDTIIHLDTFNIVKLGTVVNDTIIYESTKYPYFVDVATKKAKWHELAETKTDTIDGKVYIPTRQAIYYTLRSGDLIMAQKYRIDSLFLIEYSRSQQIYRYLKLAFDGGYTPDQLNSYPPFDTLVHWEKYHPAGIDTTIIDQ